VPPSDSAAFDAPMPLSSIGATLEQVRLNHRIGRLTRALNRLGGIADEARASGQPVPAPLAAAQGAFEDELEDARRALRALTG
jgi:hypothetical protein